jgi:arylsulfatase A-like enzyme
MSKSNFSRRRFLAQSAVAVAGLANLAGCANSQPIGAAPGYRAGRPPNLLFILADDMGWADLGVYGRTDYKTPNIDRLASQGGRLTQAYSNSSVCTPTRIAYLTGRYQQRLLVGLQEPLQNPRQLAEKGLLEQAGIPLSHPTIASLLKDKAYETALIGKWHAGYLPRFSPIKAGFDHFFGIFSGAVDYFTHRNGSGDADLWEDETPVESTGYITDLISQRAVDFLGQPARRSQPFYLSLHYTAPHWPWEGPNDEATSRKLKSLFHVDGGSLQTYGAMVRRLDEGIGQVLAALEANGLANDTLVVFTSDNGGERFSQMWPFIGSKGGVYEGSHRVPGLVRFPGRLPAGAVSPQVAATLDWTATLLKAGGALPHPEYPLDGIDLLPLLATAGGNNRTVSRSLFWRIGGQQAARLGNLKYVKLARPDQVIAPGGLSAAQRGGTEYLFDLGSDEREQANLKELRPGDFERLRQAWVEWNSTVLPEPPKA